MKKVSFTIYGKPFAKQRALKGRWSVYTPSKTVAFESVVREMAAQKFKEPIEGPVAIYIRALFEIPKSWKKSKREEALNEEYHTQKPDLDNCLKAISDGMNRVAFIDDRQIAAINCVKKWTESNARTEVTITELSEKTE